MKTKLAESVHLYLDGARGQYIPRDFARDTKRDCIEGVEPADLDYLARGPGGCLDEPDLPLADGETARGEYYWDTWQTVLDNAIVTDPDSGLRFRLHQDDSLFLVPENWEFNEETNSFERPESDTLRRYELYSHWACALINSDESGLEVNEAKAIADFLAKEDLSGWTCADVSENSWFARSPDCGGLAGTVSRYTFIKI